MLASTMDGLSFVESAEEVVPAGPDEGSTIATLTTSHISSHAKTKVNRSLGIDIHPFPIPIPRKEKQSKRI